MTRGRSGTKTMIVDDMGDGIDSVSYSSRTDETTPLIQLSGVKLQEPTDRYNLVFITFIIQGVGLTLPWNLFMTAKDYYVGYKLAPAGSASYRLNFLSYAGIAAMGSNALLNGVNLFTHCGNGRPTVRTIVSQLGMIIAFVFTIVMAVFDTSTYPQVFFFITLFTIIFVNMCTGLWANCMFGIASHFSKNYVNAVVIGSNLSGLLTALFVILSKEGSADPVISAILYFVSAVVIVFMCLISFIMLNKSEFYKNYYSDKLIQAEDESTAEMVLPYWKVFKMIWPQLFDVWFQRFVAGAVIPAMLADVVKSDPNFLIPEYHYTDIMCYLFTNFCICFGNLFVFFVHKPRSEYVVYFQMVRMLFVPFFVLCNYRPETRSKNLPVLLKSDWAFLAGVIVFATTNGHFSGLTMMYSKQAGGNDPASKLLAGMYTGFLQNFGRCFGLGMNIVIAWIVENI
ncbi:equilibrative nucleoside transporter 2-like [Tubulanus polymorphus]|uniref:equilibrative nucleoside transporter 2-like n=1 Tax=Tubulanus polymorphus TaxID=672921 RepID=UPI003DA3CBAE